MTEAQQQFNAWWSLPPNYDAPIDDEPSAIKYWAEQAWQHQQQRIDELEKKVESLSKLYISAVDQIIKQIEGK